MSTQVTELTEPYEDVTYGVFRVLVGLLFAQHGAQKLFGLFGGVDGNGGTASLMSLYGVAGIIEFIGGLLIAVGILTQLIALIGGIEMVGAYVMAHLPEGLVPIQNGGELSLLYFAAFLPLIVADTGRYSLERLLTSEN